MRGARLFLIAVLASGLTAAAAPVCAAESAKERKGQVTVEVKLRAPEGAKDVRLWIPAPVSDANQTIANVSVAGNATSSAFHEDPKSGSSILHAEWKGGTGERLLTYTFTVGRKEVLNRKLVDSGRPLPQAEVKEYLDLSWLGKTEKAVREEAARITAGKTTVLDKARAVYEWVVDNMRRDPDATACGLCDVERLLSQRMGKCADVHTVFVALCRAAGVPARDLWGIRMPKEAEGDMTKKQHCWAEFYLPGTGWVPVDAADVHKIVYDRKLTPEAARQLPERGYFFGSIDEVRILLGSAHGTLTPPQAGGPLVYFMYPYAEADGRPLGADINFNFGYTITFKELPEAR